MKGQKSIREAITHSQIAERIIKQAIERIRDPNPERPSLALDALLDIAVADIQDAIGWMERASRALKE